MPLVKGHDATTIVQQCLPKSNIYSHECQYTLQSIIPFEQEPYFAEIHSIVVALNRVATKDCKSSF